MAVVVAAVVDDVPIARCDLLPMEDFQSLERGRVRLKLCADRRAAVGV